ncbi:MAG: pyrroline-5-carboxylate reductase [Legionellaceae bacterium]|nr:pyrroline-5-carboxylate reductase [Legionellaceae bacterium]
MRVSIIGFGNMAKAFAHGLLRDPENHIQVASPSLHMGIRDDGIHTHHNNQAIIPKAEIIILAVKPSQMDAVLTEINPLLTNNQLLISIAAGLTFEWFNKHLPKHTPLVRAMPNLAAKCGESATPLIANIFVTPAQRTTAERIFLSSGIITWTEQESDLDAFTALSGSGPAYLFLFMNAMVNAGVTLGLPEEISRTFAIQTVQGAMTLAKTEQLSLTELQKTVTSKGGTTAAAIRIFQDHNLESIVLEAMKAAYQRSRELGNSNSG